MVSHTTYQLQLNIEKKIRIKKNDGLQLVPINKILYIEAETPYSYFYLTNGQKIFCSDSIRYFDRRLSTNGFVRIHKSLLVNLTCIESYHKKGSGALRLIDGTQLKLARGKKQLFFEMMDAYFSQM